MSVTIKDIAQACDVSVSTVSRALAGSRHISDVTTGHILDVARSMQYLPRRVTQEAQKSIMLIVGDITNPFYMGIASSICETLNKGKVLVGIYHSANNPALEEHYIAYAREKKFDGIIMITAIETLSLIRLLKATPCPVVLVNRFIRSMDLNAVCIDNFRGGYMATDYLIKRGHRAIAHLMGPADSTASQDRRRGYENALGDSGISCEKGMLFQGDLSRASGYSFAEYFMENLSDCTAVFCANDIMAAGFIARLGEAGVRVPEDVSVICFDDTIIARDGAVKLTTVARDPSIMGDVAADIMQEILDGKNIVKRKIVFPPILIERDSVRALG